MMKTNILFALLLGFVVLVSGCVSGNMVADKDIQDTEPVSEPQPEIQAEEPSPCQYEIFDECSGDYIERRVQHEDCTVEFQGKVELCKYGCSFGKCESEKNYFRDKCLRLSNFHYDAEGEDSKNLNDEYVTLKNDCPYSIDITGWTIEDKDHNVFVSPRFAIQGSSILTLNTGIGTSTGSKLFWQRTMDQGEIWDNDGDRLVMKDLDGDIVVEYLYS